MCFSRKTSPQCTLVYNSNSTGFAKNSLPIARPNDFRKRVANTNLASSQPSREQAQPMQSTCRINRVQEPNTSVGGKILQECRVVPALVNKGLGITRRAAQINNGENFLTVLGSASQWWGAQVKSRWWFCLYRSRFRPMRQRRSSRKTTAKIKRTRAAFGKIKQIRAEHLGWQRRVGQKWTTVGLCHAYHSRAPEYENPRSLFVSSEIKRQSSFKKISLSDLGHDTRTPGAFPPRFNASKWEARMGCVNKHSS